MNFEKERASLEARLSDLRVYETIREKAIQSMNWDCMVYHSADDEHDECYYTAPTEEDSYMYPIYQSYQRVLAILDKSMSK